MKQVYGQILLQEKPLFGKHQKQPINLFHHAVNQCILYCFAGQQMASVYLPLSSKKPYDAWCQNGPENQCME